MVEATLGNNETEQPKTLGSSTQTQSIRDCVEQNVGNYFENLGDEPTTNFYDLVLTEVEADVRSRSYETYTTKSNKSSHYFRFKPWNTAQETKAL